MIFINFGTYIYMVHKSGEGRLVLPRESFTRFQLAAIFDSPIHRSIDADWLAGWLTGCWLLAEG
jgi:hypothetical protein